MGGEALGVAIVLLGGAGASLITVNPRFLDTGLAYGLAVLVAVFVVAPLSGAHLNPAVTLANLLLGRIGARDAVDFVVGQLVGAFIGAGFLFVLMASRFDFDALEEIMGHAANGFGNNSPARFSWFGVGLVELAMTSVIVIVLCAASFAETGPRLRAPVYAAVIVMAHLMAAPVSNAGLNPAKSVAIAVFQGDWAIRQVWAFIVFPLLGAVFGAWISRLVIDARQSPGAGQTL